MTNSSISSQAEYAGYVGDEQVAYTYKTGSDPEDPYVIILHTDEGDLVVNQAPLISLDGDANPDDSAEYDRQNAISWVEHLTELVAKADAYSGIFTEEPSGYGVPVTWFVNADRTEAIAVGDGLKDGESLPPCTHVGDELRIADAISWNSRSIEAAYALAAAHLLEATQ